MAYNNSAHTYEYENGRRYHGWRAGLYMYPNDEQEADRLDIFHKLFLVARRGELHRARFRASDGPTRILDLGTGTGIWAIGMADTYSDAEVIGIDLSLIQPKWIPQNLRFQASDFESEWTLGRNSFDLIHLRVGIGSVSSWETLFSRVFQHLKPGAGWFEYVDIDFAMRSDDGSLLESSALYQWQRYLVEASSAAGKSLAYRRDTRQLLHNAGFVDIEEIVLKIPINPWPTEPNMKTLGLWYSLGMQEGLEAFSLGPLCRVMKWPIDDVKRFLDDVRKDMKNRSIRAYNTMHIWTARRPDATPVPSYGHPSGVVPH
ncbi:S-adenosyl-L-methionine-dependent methyltransferase [Pyronema domesticum]|uniref:Similar to Ubiquinone/menaquinone biosynthesis methyltransferase ubiE acc. no. Q3A209 n=1 Tax=Pyronema omphalodes (strain CBS 100304) TaxID=1076935 RepID=U4L9A1_PYROM|nr:S-adenosyl-L-methionine-dependent methyltransferase [Pyronema domesticum]CCX06764.1 Similar to Ubiquinone/menaquinone biosynthesis methyltransferase ubiE; acc. no. Q3A209 [Pyronema omphalodes CBS 100304]